MEQPENFNPVIRKLSGSEAKEFEVNGKITLQITGMMADMLKVGQVMALSSADGSTLAGRVVKTVPHTDGGMEVELDWVAD